MMAVQKGAEDNDRDDPEIDSAAEELVAEPFFAITVVIVTRRKLPSELAVTWP